MSHDAVDLENLPVSAEEAHAELEIVLRSPMFDRSERLHKFLRYICELTLKGGARESTNILSVAKSFIKAPITIPTKIRLFGGRPTRFERSYTNITKARGSRDRSRSNCPSAAMFLLFGARKFPQRRVLWHDIEADRTRAGLP